MSEVGRPRQRPRPEPHPADGEDEIGAERTVMHLPGQPLPPLPKRPVPDSIFDEEDADERTMIHNPDRPDFDAPPPASQGTMALPAPFPPVRPRSGAPAPLPVAQPPARVAAVRARAPSLPPIDRPPTGPFQPSHAPPAVSYAPPPMNPYSQPPMAGGYGPVPTAPQTQPTLGQYAPPRPQHPSVPPPRFSLPYVPMRRREEEEEPPKRRGRLVAIAVGALVAVAVAGGLFVRGRKPASGTKPNASGSPSASMSSVVGDTARPLAITGELVAASFVGDLTEDVVTVGSLLSPATEATKRRVIAVDGSTFAIAWISPPLPSYDPTTNIAVANGRVVVPTEPKKVVVYNGVSGAELYALETPTKILSICSKNRSGRDVWIELANGGGATLDVMFGKLVTSVAVPSGCPTVETRPDSTTARVNPHFVRPVRPLAAMPAGAAPFIDNANGAYEDPKRKAVVGVDALTGAELWTHAIPATTKGPGLLGIGNRTVFLAEATPTGAPALSCVEAETGIERWKLVSPDTNAPGFVYLGRRRAYVVRGSGADVVDLSSGRVLGRIGSP